MYRKKERGRCELLGRVINNNQSCDKKCLNKKYSKMRVVKHVWRLPSSSYRSPILQLRLRIENEDFHRVRERLQRSSDTCIGSRAQECIWNLEPQMAATARSTWTTFSLAFCNVFIRQTKDCISQMNGSLCPAFAKTLLWDKVELSHACWFSLHCPQLLMKRKLRRLGKRTWIPTSCSKIEV